MRYRTPAPASHYQMTAMPGRHSHEHMVRKESTLGQDTNGAPAFPRQATRQTEPAAALSSPDSSAPRGDEPWIRLYQQPEMPLPAVVPSPIQRRWYPPNAYHCTPMLKANQLGWSVLTPVPIQVVWDGGETRQGVTFDTSLPRQVPGFG